MYYFIIVIQDGNVDVFLLQVEFLICFSLFWNLFICRVHFWYARYQKSRMWKLPRNSICAIKRVRRTFSKHGCATFCTKTLRQIWMN